MTTTLSQVQAVIGLDESANLVRIHASAPAGFDPRGANEAGFPWEADYARLNPAYFVQADLRMAWLVRAGLVPAGASRRRSR